MEPPEQTDGNPVCGGGINDAASASMEPPEQTDGNLASVILSKSVERLQWSHQNKLMEIIDRLRDWLKAAASMEPPEQTDGNLFGPWFNLH